MKRMNLRNKIIKHTNAMDVCYDVVKCFDVGHKLKLKAQIVNQAYAKSYHLNIEIKIEIYKEDLCNWHVCMQPEVACLRYAEWRRLV